MDHARDVEEPLMTGEEKSLHHHLSSRHSRQHNQAASRTYRFIILGSLLAAGWLFLSCPGMPSLRTICSSYNRDDVQPKATGKVALEAHIMSKCPDARDCLTELIMPFMEQHSDLVDFRLSYIGEIHNSSEAYATVQKREEDLYIDSPSDDSKTVVCMHGPMECLGNIIELCAAHLYPDPKTYLGFVNCLTLSYSQIPDGDLVRDCALEHAIDVDKLDKCLVKDEGSFGMKLLLDSVKRSKDAGVRYSCTVRLQDEIRCIRDGGKWKDCPGGSSVEDLVRDVKNLSGGQGEIEDKGDRLDLIWT